MLLTTFTVTGTPSFIRSSGPGEVPLYPMVLRMRLGANSTVTGAICSVKSVLATSCGAGWRQKGLRLLAHQPAACGRQPGNLEKVASLHEKSPHENWYSPVARHRYRNARRPKPPILSTACQQASNRGGSSCSFVTVTRRWRCRALLICFKKHPR